MDVVTVIQRRGNAQPTKPFPALECVLGTTTPIHECLVECIADSGSRTFIVAIQERPGTPNATLIETLRLPGEDWCMEVIVMQLGPDGSVVDFGSGGDQLNLAKNAVCRYVVFRPRDLRGGLTAHHVSGQPACPDPSSVEGRERDRSTIPLPCEPPC